MQARNIALGIAAVLCVAVVLAGPASAVFQSGERSRGPVDGERMEGLLERLEARGFDVSSIRAAVEAGDTDAARTLLHEFREEHSDAFPAPEQEKRRGTDMSGHLDRLEDQGYDVRPIRAAIENGDNATARSLMQEFLEEHKEELPSPPRLGDRQGNLTSLLDHLEEQGFDVSEIRSAVEIGDTDTVHILLEQFREEY